VTGGPPRSELSILVVDDDTTFRERLVKAFAARGFTATGAASGDAALDAAARHAPDFAVIDLRMPKMSGLEVVKRLRALAPGARIVVLTGYGSIATAVAAIRSGAIGYLTKPADADEILATLEGKGPPAVEETQATVPSLARVEWEHIERVLVECGGNITQAAAKLGMHRRSLQRKLAKQPYRR